MAKNYLDKVGLSYLWSKIVEALQPMTEHIESAHAPASAEENVIVSIKKNGSAVAPVNKVVDLSIPVKTSDLTNDSDFATQTQLSEAVSEAGHLKALVVSELPSVSNADGDTIYFLPKEDGESGNQYTEYKLVDGSFEEIGETKADLSAYATQDYVDKADDTLITSIVNNSTSTDEKYVGTANLALFWTLIQSKIPTDSVTDLLARVDLLEMYIYNEDITGNPFYVTFTTLDDVSVAGVWNESEAQIEF